MEKHIIYILIFLLVLPVSLGATIYGSIYDNNLERVFDVTVEVNSSPYQRQVAKQGMYSFGIYPGVYVITATKEVDGEIVLRTDERIAVVGDGTFVYDLFLKPTGDSGYVVEPDKDDNFLERNFIVVVISGSVLIALIIIYLIVKLVKKRKPKVSTENEDQVKEVLEIIKAQGGRTTQKDIRKEMSLSEAKVSLLISELEANKKIQKIKKGRGNIIILK